jgi:MFS transporter, MCT family, solute carrier family 16 (monocarboxylic acid transporters), member 10
MAGDTEDHDSQPRMMLIRGFFAQNVAIGCAFSGLAVSVLALEERYQTSRAMAEMALAVIVLAMSLFAPVAGAMIVRIGLRKTMTIGVVLSAVGYAALAYSPSMRITLGIAALLIGPGAAFFGSIPSSILASSWFPKAQGKALGIVNVPLFVALVPLLGIVVIERFGLTAFYLCLASLHIALLPLMIGVKEPPRPPGKTVQPPDEGPPDRHAARHILTHSIFWLIVLGDGVLNGANITNSAHIVPLAVEAGISTSAAAILLSASGCASILGSLFSGFLSDRMGAARTLALVGVGLAVSWGVLATTTWYPGLMFAMILCGGCGAAVFPPTNILLTQVFGLRALPQALGLLGPFGLPFTFAMSPAVGAIHDMAGNYRFAFVALALMCALVALEFLLIGRWVERARKAARLNALARSPERFAS